MYEIYQRLLDEKGIKNSDISRATGISNMTLSDWKRGVSKPKSDKMKKIADFLGVSVEYLETGEEPQSAFTIEMAEIDLQLLNQNKRLKEYMLKLAELPKDKQENILNLIDMLREEK